MYVNILRSHLLLNLFLFLFTKHLPPNPTLSLHDALPISYILALLDTNGTPVWHGLGRADYPTATNEGNIGQTTSVKHALVDFAGDGTFQIASAGYGDGVRAIDPRDGKVLWSLPAPAPTCPRVVAVDIDGRKGDELLYVAGSKIGRAHV